MADLHKYSAIFADNRSRFLRALGRDAALIFGAPQTLRNGDTEHRYRPDSDILYLSGWCEPECVLVLRPGAEQPFTMFVQPRDPQREQWTGSRPGPEGAIAHYGADAAHPIAELSSRLPNLLQGYRNLHYTFGVDARRDQLVRRAILKARRDSRTSRKEVPDCFFDLERVLHEQRLIKSDSEIGLLERSAELTRQAHLNAMGMTADGVGEYELEAEIEATFRRGGGNGPGYPTIVGGGLNATILHYTRNQDLLQAGDLVCVDAGCELAFYTTDVTRTWPVSGRFSAAQRTLYQIVLDAQKAAIACCQVGGSWQQVHDTATRELTRGMLSLGLLEPDSDGAEDETESASDVLDRLIKAGRQKRYYMHGTSHWLGLDVHDVGAYMRGGEARPFEPGMVLTVEPGIYIGRNDEKVSEAYRGIGIRIEDDVLITAAGPRILTAAIPKEIDDIERVVGLGAGTTTARP